MHSPTSGLGWRSLMAVGLALAFLVGLGTWQLQRKQWKEALLAEIAARGLAEPVSVAPPTGPEHAYRRVRLSGSFVADSARHIFISVPRQAGGIGGPGYWVFQQFQHAGSRLYVNRGFVPEADKGKDWGAPQDVTVEGVFRLPEPRVRFSNANDPAKNVYYVRAPVEFLEAAKEQGMSVRLDAYVDMTGPLPAGGLPLPMVGKITIPNRHLEYALTWYALAATLAGVALAMARRRA